MGDSKEMQRAVLALNESLERLVTAYAIAGAYMPGIATLLRIYADEMADRYPDDTNGGHQ